MFLEGGLRITWEQQPDLPHRGDKETPGNISPEDTLNRKHRPALIYAPSPLPMHTTNNHAMTAINAHLVIAKKKKGTVTSYPAYIRWSR